MLGFTNANKKPIPITFQVVSLPTRTSYGVGQALDTSGMVLKFVQGENEYQPTSIVCTVPSGDINNLQVTDTLVTVTATYNGIVRTTSYAITVLAYNAVVRLTTPSYGEYSRIKTYIQYNGASYYTVGDTFYMSGGETFKAYCQLSTMYTNIITLNGALVKSERYGVQAEYTYTCPTTGVTTITITTSGFAPTYEYCLDITTSTT